MHVLLQGIGVGGFQLRELAPFEDLSRQLMSGLREFIEERRGRGPLSARRLLGAGQAHLAEKNIANLLRASKGKGLAGHLMNLMLQTGERLGKVSAEPAK